ncbi:MAG: 50S ribosomal protein L25 [Candidatus Nealsonbacteria bacterium CG_4_10_14_0_2_um_filter_40_15]|uniref:Large ribosomal subunit protein bL25 n=2 Tax=Candidatus Nealsoniibacteriota TaxID=1817911 RepID=A0A2M7D8I6_9BACT|nr:MAG: 50S ribosomal protein L25 [Candidatus Nealsonbacteria bacterium CG02_land_8_20_14_3_00_40_11]PIZ86758.1 MAG: 50S ribosomal protein L25 [Candidatus Nealsonbacteria bacterium CG_4_10_14_0_2_um_filter_40_15]
MLVLSATIRKDLGKKVKNLRKMGIAPAVLYGPKTESLSLEINLKEFEKIYAKARGSSLISLTVNSKNFLVLIHAVETDAISQKPIHIDFYQPRLDEEIAANIPLVFEGESLAVKDLGGTLVKNIHEVQVKALPQNLPHEIKVDIEKLKTLQDVVLIKDLILPQGVKIIRDQQEIVASVVLPEKVEEELAKPVEEKVEEVEKVGGEKKGEEEEAEKAEPAAKVQPAQKAQEKTK